MDVSSYYLAGPRVLLDPMAPDEVLDRLEALGPPAEAVLTNRHHYRDCDEVRDRFGCPVRAPRVGMHELAAEQPVEPYDFGDELAGGAVRVFEVGGISPDESALHVAAAGALAVADGVVNYGALTFVPDHYMDEPPQTKKRLRQAYAKLAETVEFDHLLTAHGPPVIGEGREALRRFAASSGG